MCPVPPPESLYPSSSIGYPYFLLLVPRVLTLTFQVFTCLPNPVVPLSHPITTPSNIDPTYEFKTNTISNNPYLHHPTPHHPHKFAKGFPYSFPSFHTMVARKGDGVRARPVTEQILLEAARIYDARDEGMAKDLKSYAAFLSRQDAFTKVRVERGLHVVKGQKSMRERMEDVMVGMMYVGYNDVHEQLTN